MLVGASLAELNLRSDNYEVVEGAELGVIVFILPLATLGGILTVVSHRRSEARRAKLLACVLNVTLVLGAFLTLWICLRR